MYQLFDENVVYCAVFQLNMNENEDILFNWRLRKSYITVIVSLSLVLFLLGSIGFLILNAGRLSDYMRENIGFAVILKEKVKEAEIFRLQKMLDAAPYIKSTRYVTKEQAAEELKKDLGEDFVDFLGYNPLMSSIEVQLNANYANIDSINVIEAKLIDYPQVKDVFYQRLLIQKVNENVRRMSLILLAFGGMLLVISVALINNTIRLAIFSKRFIINTMKLIGATESFIRRPFLITAILHGVLGGIFANLLLMGLINFVNREIEQVVGLSYIGILFFIVVILGIAINVVSTYFALKKYFRLTIEKLYIW